MYHVPDADTLWQLPRLACLVCGVIPSKLALLGDQAMMQPFGSMECLPSQCRMDTSRKLTPQQRLKHFVRAFLEPENSSDLLVHHMNLKDCVACAPEVVSPRFATEHWQNLHQWQDVVAQKYMDGQDSHLLWCVLRVADTFNATPSACHPFTCLFEDELVQSKHAGSTRLSRICAAPCCRDLAPDACSRCPDQVFRS